MAQTMSNPGAVVWADSLKTGPNGIRLKGGMNLGLAPQ